LKQYGERFENVFKAFDRDKVLMELLAGGRGKDSTPAITKKTQEARKIVADVSLKKGGAGPSNAAEHVILRSDLHPTLKDVPQEGPPKKGAASGDCIASDSLAWRITTDGHCQRVPLHDVRAGDHLLALDSQTGETTSAQVQRLLLIPPRDSVKVELIDGSVMICTGDHPVLCCAARTRALEPALHVVHHDMYSKPANELKRGEDSVCILASGLWVALPLLHEPQALEEDDIDMPQALVNFAMVDDSLKPFVILCETMGANSHGIAVGSSPEADNLDLESVWSSETASSDGRSFVLVGALIPDQVSLRETRALPRNERGDLTSFGSLDHNDMDPTLCYICWPHRNRGSGCRFGVLCDRCHRHHPEVPTRLRHHQRRRGGGVQ
jgi:hypothetical protein